MRKKRVEGSSNAKDAKAPNLLDQMGLDVTIKSEGLEDDALLQNRLKQIGTDIKPNGMSYRGSIAIHFYDSVLAREVAWVLQDAISADISEAVVSNAFKDAAIKLRKSYNPSYKYKTLDKRDKRSEV